MASKQADIAADLADRARDIRSLAHTDVVRPETVDQLCLIVERLAECVAVLAGPAPGVCRECDHPLVSHGLTGCHACLEPTEDGLDRECPCLKAQP